MACGIEHVDDVGQPPAEPGRHRAHRLPRPRIAGRGVDEQRVHRPRSVPVGDAGRSQQRMLTDVGLQASGAAAMARRAVRVDRHVPDLARIAAAAVQLDAFADDAATDTDAAVEVHQMVVADGGAPLMFGHRAQVGVVADHHVRAAGHFLRQQLGERNRAPIQVRRVLDEAVPIAHRARNRDADPDRCSATGPAVAQPLGVGHDPGDDRLGPSFGAIDRDQPALVHHAAETDGGGDDAFHRDIHRQHVRTVRARGDQVGRSPRTITTGRDVLADQAEADQVGYQSTDGAPVQPGGRGQVGSGQLAMLMDVPKQQAEIEPTDLLRPNRSPAAGAHPRPVEPARRRDKASTVAARVSTAPVTIA